MEPIILISLTRKALFESPYTLIAVLSRDSSGKGRLNDIYITIVCTTTSTLYLHDLAGIATAVFLPLLRDLFIRCRIQVRP